MGKVAASGGRVRRTRLLGLLAACVVGLALVPWVGAEAHRGGGHHGGDRDGKLLFFASDGMVQSTIDRYADQGKLPGFRDLLRHGAYASGNGLLTQAPPNTGAGWYTLATGAWPGVHGSTNNTFHINGQPFAQPHRGVRRRARCCRPRRSRSPPSAAARRSPRSSGRAAAAARSTGRRVDFRNFRSGRGVATNYISPTDSAAFTQSFGLQFDHPDGFAGNRALPAGPRRPTRPAGPTCPRPTARRRRCACACSTAASTSTASTPTSTTAATTARRATTASSSRRRRTATTRSATCARASGPTSR